MTAEGDDQSGLPLGQMQRDAARAFAVFEAGDLLPAELAADLACHVLALIAAGAGRMPRTIVHRPGGRWDLFEDAIEGGRFAEAMRAVGWQAEAWNVSYWRWHPGGGRDGD